MTGDPFPRTRLTGAFERRVGRALAAHVVEGAPVLVAVSGGPDSTAALVTVARALGADRVIAAFFDHRLRPTGEVAGERAVVVEVAAQLGTGFVAGRATRRPSDASEEAAREARYRWLARETSKAGAAVCITGHTMDDQAETVLLRLARGTAAGGAAGMAASAAWPVPARGTAALQVVRPLLDVSRAEVEAYLNALGIVAALDPSNATLEYARNSVRLEVLPALRAVNTRAAEHLAQFATRQREDDETLRAVALEWLAEHSTEHSTRGATRGGGAPASVELDRRALSAAPPAVARRIVWEAAASIGVPLEAAHVLAILRSASKSRGNVDLPLARSEANGKVLRLRLRPSPTGTD